MANISRRGVVRAGVWSVPAVAVVAAAPAVAASTAPEIRITSIAPRGFGDRTDVFYTVDGVPTGPTRIVRVSRTPSDGSTIGPDFAVSQGPGSGSFTAPREPAPPRNLTAPRSAGGR